MPTEDIYLKEALYYASKGWAVFPVHSVREDGSCNCPDPKCGDIGKHPIASQAPHGLLDASKDPKRIGTWWEARPGANIGLRTGKESGVIVVDIDPRHGGDEQIMLLQSEHGKLPDTMTVETGGGGTHYYFRHPGVEVGNRANLFPGIDIRGDGGYVVAPPSRHASGNTYQWDFTHNPEIQPLAGLPDWLLGPMLQGTRSRSSETTTVEGPIVSGGRNDTLFSMASSMRGKGFDFEAIYSALMTTNETRCTPPLSESDIRKIANSAASQPANRISRRTEPDFSFDETEGLMSVSDFVEQDEDPVSWVVDELLMCGGTSLLVAKPKIGKSVLARNLVTTVAAGWPLFLGRPVKQGKVVYLALEEHRAVVREHFQKMGATREVIGDQAHIWVGLGPQHGLEWIRGIVDEYAPDLLIFDPAQTLLRLANVNDYSEVMEAMGVIEDIARSSNCHIMVVHHENKGTEGSIGTRVLGSQAFFAKVDSLITMQSVDGIRTLHTELRKGEDFTGQVVIYDRESGLIRLGTTVDDRKVEIERDSVLRVMVEGTAYSKTQIGQSTGLPGERVTEILHALVDEKRLQQSTTTPPYYRKAAPLSVEELMERPTFVDTGEEGMAL